MAGPVPGGPGPASTWPAAAAALSEPAHLRAELMAAAVVAAHNHVLRRWLRGESPDPVRELDDALNLVISLFTGPAVPPDLPPDLPPDGKGATIVAFRTGQDIDALIPVLRRLADE
jgi:hypothetical protein